MKSIALPLPWLVLVAEKDFQTAAVPVDFFYAKGILEALFARLGLDVTYTATSEIASLHQGVQPWSHLVTKWLGSSVKSIL